MRAGGLLLIFLVLVSAGGQPTSRVARPIVFAGPNRSFNWSGYVQGALEKGTTFHAVSAEWIVPKAKQRTAGEAEFSASWIGVGGGCLDSACSLTDVTLIQAGIGHDIDAAGQADYYAWWEAIPAPSVRTDLVVHPGDLVRVTVAESATVAEVWTITIVDRDTGGSFAITLPYASSYGSAEWVIETPVVISDAGAITVGPMPDLARVHFDRATANGGPPALTAAERIELVDFDLSPIASPSLPDRTADGFNDCTFRTSCPAPAHELPD